MNPVSPASASEEMIRRQLVERGITDPRVLEAMRAVPRERFFSAGHQKEAYADQASPIGFGQTISQPYIVALMTQSLRVEPTDRVLEIGGGSGYQTAILAHLAKEVYMIERVKPLLDEAWNRLMEMGFRNIHFRHGDGTRGWPEAAPFDRILIAAAAPALPEVLLKSQLKEGGIAILPVGPHDHQELLEVRRQGDQLLSTVLIPCRFVKLIGLEGWES
jgi:protein-L-isoaspartate(D-aspartate) O-methyltransferase